MEVTLMTRMLTNTTWGALTAAFLVGCSNESSAPPAAVASILVSPPGATISIDQTVQLSAVLRDASGTLLTDRTISWLSGNAAIAGVDDSGRVTGVSAGTANVIATSEGISDTAVITVQPAPEPTHEIVFASSRDGDVDIYVMNADGTGIQQLINHPAIDNAPSWSPDGTRIAFVSRRDGNYEAYVINADGSGLARVTNNPANDFAPFAWSPDGTKIAFASDRAGVVEIYVMNADGSNVTPLTDQAGGDVYPSWSPDGSKITFASGRDGNAEIYVVNADGSGLTRLTDNPAYDSQAGWSPDGSKIVFVSDRDGNWEIYVMNADGSGVTRLTDNPALDEIPSWSPDGTSIIFDGLRDGSAAEIYVMNSDGTGVRRLTNNPAGDFSARWRAPRELGVILGEWSYASVLPPPEPPSLNTGLRVTIVINHIDGTALHGRVALWFAGDVGLPPTAFGPVTGTIDDAGMVSLHIPRTAVDAAPITIAGTVDGRHLTIRESRLGEAVPGPFPSGGCFERSP
jgi:Tol biopolymer transport system component